MSASTDRRTPRRLLGRVHSWRVHLLVMVVLAAAAPIATGAEFQRTVDSVGPASPGSGYWMLGSDGSVHAFGSAPDLGAATGAGAPTVSIESTPDRKGYWILDALGRVHAFGDAMYLGGADLSRLASMERVTTLSSTPSGQGYWIFTSRGRALPFGDATFYGDMSRTALNGAVVGSVATASGQGYYLVGSDGGIFTFGDARFWGSMGGVRLNAPVEGLVPTPDGGGYWLVAADGGVFSFGDATFRGSMGGTRLNRPVVGMIGFGDGYLMVASDGGIFDFSDQPFDGSLGADPPASPIVGVAAGQAVGTPGGPAGVGAGTSSGGFVRAAGTGLTLNGQPYRFDGMDIYDVNSNGGCVGKLDPAAALNAIGGGQEMFRAYFFQPWATTASGQRDWSAFDATLAAAQAHGEKVVAVLGNEWNYCDGPQKFLAWWQGGYANTIEPGDTTPYRQWVREVVSRYAANPAIGIWDLMNEGDAVNPDGSCSESTAAAAMRSFSDDVGGLVHSLDPNHIVTLGSISADCGSKKGDYQYVYASPGSDLCDYHDYDYPNSPMGNTDPYYGLQAMIDHCHADGKPLAVLETGIHYTQLTPPTTTTRAALFRQKFSAQFGAGVVGELLWDYSPTPAPSRDYEIGPSDPAVGLLSLY